jgi:AcrR family transcriptional regulator
MTEGANDPRSQPKGDKRSRTRAALLAATRDLVRERGYGATTMEDIAQRAGMTTGAIYNNFRNREDLFIALSDEYWPPIVPKVEAGADFPQIMRAMAEATLAAVPDRQAAAIGFLTGRAYAIDHEETRKRAQEKMEEGYAFGAAWLKDIAAKDDLPFPPEVMIGIIHALTEGLLLQRFLAPQLVNDEVFRAAFDLLALKRTRSEPKSNEPAK